MSVIQVIQLQDLTDPVQVVSLDLASADSREGDVLPLSDLGKDIVFTLRSLLPPEILQQPSDVVEVHLRRSSANPRNQLPASAHIISQQYYMRYYLTRSMGWCLVAADHSPLEEIEDLSRVG